jgi:hypothetical protein
MRTTFSGLIRPPKVSSRFQHDILHNEQGYVFGSLIQRDVEPKA